MQTPQTSFIRAFSDNYIWTLSSGPQTVVVDPGDAKPVLNWLKQNKRKLAGILLTHQHNDHTGGVAGLLAKFSVPVYGGANEGIDSVTQPVAGGDTITLDALGGLEISVLDVPGHTLGHVAYYVPSQKWLFCGDLLFGAGCGRIFEGTAAQMYDSLQKIAALPDDTLIFCGHEYTLPNLKFAAAVEPENPAIEARVKESLAKRQKYLPTLPSTLAEEKATNPFLRADQETVMERMVALGRTADKTPLGAFTAVRTWKDDFVG